MYESTMVVIGNLNYERLVCMSVIVVVVVGTKIARSRDLGI